MTTPRQYFEQCFPVKVCDYRDPCLIIGLSEHWIVGMKRLDCSAALPLVFTIGIAILVAEAPAQEVPAQDVERLLQLAEQGNAEAQYRLGLFSSLGNGMPLDLQEAARWNKLAAEQGHARAQVSLGLSYAIGFGVSQDYREAVKWFRLAAEQGDAEGQESLGRVYALGLGVPQDYQESVRWYKLAAVQGNALAQTQLAGAYLIGRGIPQDYQEGIRWFRHAAEQGDATAQMVLGSMYEEVFEDNVQALAWYYLAAASGFDDASAAAENLFRQMTTSQVERAMRLRNELSGRIEANKSP